MKNLFNLSGLFYSVCVVMLLLGCEQNLQKQDDHSRLAIQNHMDENVISNRTNEQNTINHTVCAVQDNVNVKQDEKIALIIDDAQVVDQNSFSATESGTANLIFRYSENLLSGNVVFTQTAPTKVHVHQGYAGQTGDLVFALVQNTTNPAIWDIEEIMDPVTEVFSNAVDSNTLAAGGYYLNVHFGNDPTSPTLRAQIVSNDVKFNVAPLIAHNGITTIASGFAGASANEINCQVSAFVTLVDLVDVTGVHLHIEDENGSTSNKIVLELDTSVTTATVYKIADADSFLNFSDLANVNAGHWYINVHTATNTSGELIGYLDASHFDFIPLTIDASQVVDPIAANATDTAAANFMLDTVTGMFAGGVTFTGEIPEKVHIHSGYAGQTGDLAIELVQDVLDSSQWKIAEADYFTLDQSVLEAGGYYLNVHLINGIDTLRSQILQHGISVSVASFVSHAGIITNGSGFAGITVDRKVLPDGGYAVKGFVTPIGLMDITGVHLHIEDIDLVTTQKIVLEANLNGVFEIPTTEVLTDAALKDIAEGRWYINVHTALNVDGELIGYLSAIP